MGDQNIHKAFEKYADRHGLPLEVVRDRFLAAANNEEGTRAMAAAAAKMAECRRIVDEAREDLVRAARHFGPLVV